LAALFDPVDPEIISVLPSLQLLPFDAPSPPPPLTGRRLYSHHYQYNSHTPVSTPASSTVPVSTATVDVGGTVETPAASAATASANVSNASDAFYDTMATLEVWVSRSLATFGTRAAVVNTDDLHNEGATTARLTEGSMGDTAEGRYVYLRSFGFNLALRIDGVRVFALQESRRLEEEDGEPTPPPSAAFSWPKVYHMRNLTAAACANDTVAPIAAKDARQQAAMLWAELSEDESVVACRDCLTQKPTNCTAWFLQPYGMRGGHTQKMRSERRRMREQLDRDEPERTRRLEEALGSSCCKTNRRTGKKECGKQHCAKAFKAHADLRMAQVLRDMHGKPHVKDVNLNIAQLVATDMIAPHLHHDSKCQDSTSRDNHGHLECIASSVVKHLGEKHGFSELEINKKMERFGVTVADIMTAQLRHSVSGKSSKTKPYESDLKMTDQASAMRRAEVARRKLGVDEARPPKRKAPRASWLKRSTRHGRRLAEASGDAPPATGVERLAVSGKDLRRRRKDHEQFVRNQTLAAKQILKTGNLAVATTGARPVTVSNLMGSAWDASIASDGSLIGRMRTTANALGKVGEKMTLISDLVKDARSAPPAPPPPFHSSRRRKLTAREELHFDHVDNLVGNVGKGFKVPDHVNEQWGWVSESVDWSYWFDEAHRVGRILYDRHDWVHQHAEETGTLPIGQLAAEHQTGYSFLDINAPPSYLGSWLRSKVTGGTRHAPHRNLKEKRGLHELRRAEPPDDYEPRSMVGAFIDAAVNDRDPLDAAWKTLHFNQHHTSVRRLADFTAWASTETLDSLAGATMDYGEKLVPVVFGESTGNVPGEPTAGASDVLRQAARYISYDTLLCYLYPPNSMSGAPMGDGSPIVIHYSNRACFPMIPYLPPDMKTFNDAFNLGTDFEWESLEYTEQCDSSIVKALIGPMMGDLSTIGFIAAPYGSILRFAEGIDSLRNLGKTGDATLTNSQRGSAIVCAIAQLGGLIWMAIFLIFLGAFCVCAPIGSWLCLKGYRICRGARRRDARREIALDTLIDNYEFEFGSKSGVNQGVGAKRVHKLGGHTLLPTQSE